MKKDDIILALVKDIVDLAKSTEFIIDQGMFKNKDLGEIHLTRMMCEEILKRFTREEDDGKE